MTARSGRSGKLEATEYCVLKIYIIGGPGAGKTYLASRLAEESKIPHYDLDDLQWDNKADAYGVKRDPAERDRLLCEILEQTDWIIEGVYYAWCGRCFEDADKIYLLRVPRRTYRYRLIRRFIRRKLGLEKGKKETVGSLLRLLEWADAYQGRNLVEIENILQNYPDKVITG